MKKIYLLFLIFFTSFCSNQFVNLDKMNPFAKKQAQNLLLKNLIMATAISQSSSSSTSRSFSVYNSISDIKRNYLMADTDLRIYSIPIKGSTDFAGQEVIVSYTNNKKAKTYKTLSDSNANFIASIPPELGSNSMKNIIVKLGSKQIKFGDLDFYYGNILESGGRHSGYIKPESANLYTWGGNNQGQLGRVAHTYSDLGSPVLNNVASISFDGNTCMALKKDGTVYTWGSNKNGWYDIGHLGHGVRKKTESTPTKLQNIPKMVMSVFGGGHGLMLSESNEIWSFGLNESGQLGVNSFTNLESNNKNGSGSKVYILAENKPIKIEKGFEKNDRIIQIAAGGGFSSALTEKGEVYIWGSNANGEHCDGTKDATRHPLPTKIKNIPKIRFLAPSGGFLQMISENGKIINCGASEGLAMGLGRKIDWLKKPTETVNVSNVKFSFTNGNATFAFLKDQSLLGWGDNDLGYLGSGDVNSIVLPSTKVIEKVDHKQIRAIGVSTQVIAVLRDGTMYSWGWNIHGSLGSSKFKNYWTQPTPIKFKDSNSLK